MSTTVLDALYYARNNFSTVGRTTGVEDEPIFIIATGQLTNAIIALENGMNPDDVIQENPYAPILLQKENK